MSGFKNVEILKMDSVEAASRFEDNSIDMVFIDGAHDKRIRSTRLYRHCNRSAKKFFADVMQKRMT